MESYTAGTPYKYGPRLRRRRLLIAHHDGYIFTWDHYQQQQPPTSSNKQMENQGFRPVPLSTTDQPLQLLDHRASEPISILLHPTDSNPVENSTSGKNDVNVLGVTRVWSTGSVVRCLAADGWHVICGSDDKTIKVRHSLILSLLLNLIITTVKS
ncbi:unnamed protein product [Protopolystoma xenopodis]|uniref:Uncharacterized protein n=1 Tax=Protopolystoma xenopodis TaxID=117903 RepID=A0A448WEI9_9PLAT|nr:unnamed protein product [Protopolystoma xenopodis]